MLETPAQSFWKSRNYAPVKNFQDQKFENATDTLLITRPCNGGKVQDIDNNLHVRTFHVEIFSCLRHPQSHSTKVKTMHLLRIFKIKSLKMRL